VWPSLDAIADHWELDLEVGPDADAVHVAAGYRDWQRAVERSRNWAHD
jgi:glycerol kinase